MPLAGYVMGVVDLNREPQTIERDPRQVVGPSGYDHPAPDSELFGWLPRTTLREVRLERLLSGWTPDDRPPPALRWLDEAMGGSIAMLRPEILWRASGLQRPSLVVQLAAPRLGTRLAVGIEVPLAHTIVNRLLGFERAFAESRLQLTPVEWGIGTFLALRMIDSLAASGAKGRGGAGSDASALDPRELSIDRVGPDPFDPTDLGAMVTVRWSVRLGDVTAAMRLWMPESVVTLWTAPRPVHATASWAGKSDGEDCGQPFLADARPESLTDTTPSGPVPLDSKSRLLEVAQIGSGDSVSRVPRGELAGTWRAVVGQVPMPRGLARLRVGGVLPLSGSQLTGTPASPSGPVDLILELDGQSGGFHMSAAPVADSAAHLVRIDTRPIYQTRARDPIAGIIQEGPRMNQPNPAAASSSPATAPMGPLDVPVTLTVELGRVNLTLSQLADLKPGDVVELARNSRAPVELTSNGRLVARGELILIDTDLGVRVTSVFL